MTAPPKLQPSRTELSYNLPNTREKLRHPRTSINLSQANPDTPLTPPSGLKHQQTAADITSHCQTLSDTPQLCLGVFKGVCVMSVGVCWCLLVSFDVCWCLDCVGVCGGVSGGYLGHYLACLKCSNTFRGVYQSSILMEMS